MSEQTCQWKYSKEEEKWQTSCDSAKAQQKIGLVKENQFLMNFCPCCGKRLKTESEKRVEISL